MITLMSAVKIFFFMTCMYISKLSYQFSKVVCYLILMFTFAKNIPALSFQTSGNIVTYSQIRLTQTRKNDRKLNLLT